MPSTTPGRCTRFSPMTPADGPLDRADARERFCVAPGALRIPSTVERFSTFFSPITFGDAVGVPAFGATFGTAGPWIWVLGNDPGAVVAGKALPAGAV